MPLGDGKGPLGLGPMTGKRAGYCAGYPESGYLKPCPGRGLRLGLGNQAGLRRGSGREANRVIGHGIGRSRGRGRWLCPQGLKEKLMKRIPFSAAKTNPQIEISVLEQQAKILQKQLDAISQRLEHLSS